MDGQNEQAAQAETKRGRVRRLLFGPLGFRFRREVAEGERHRFLDHLADDLAYLSDASLAALAEMLRSHGQGHDRNLWPDRATFLGFAEAVEPRPVEELPALLSWFGSVEGPRAIAEGTLVETFLYIRDRKAPPFTDQARKRVTERAAEANRKLAIIAERRAAGLQVPPDDLAWERWYLDRRAACEAIVARERAARGHTGEAA